MYLYIEKAADSINFVTSSKENFKKKRGSKLRELVIVDKYEIKNTSSN